jgi:hypothetical protein
MTAEDRFCVFAYAVPNEKLPAATALMNCNASHFESRVIGIIQGEAKSTLLVKHTNDYPYMINEWERQLEIPL